jgi:hypothetical protein
LSFEETWLIKERSFCLNEISGVFFLYEIYMIDLSEFLKRAIKYVVEGIMVAFACYAIPKGKGLSMDEVALIALSAAATFSILDTYIPSMGVTARTGAGFGIGANLVGFPR